MTISPVNVQVLRNLVDTSKDEFSAADSLSLDKDSDLAIALGVIMAEEKQAKVKAAAEEIRKLLGNTNHDISVIVDGIRTARMNEQFLLKKLARINTAKAYGAATMNFLPLVSALQGDTQHQVPDDFQSDGTPLS